MTQLRGQERSAVSTRNKNSGTKPGPFLKWVGGKTQLLSQFQPLFPTNFRRYYEPFVGSGAVFFHLQPEDAVLSDLNPHVIAVYQHLQGNIDALVARLYDIQTTYHALSKEQQEQAYYQARARYNALPSESLEKAALLIFLNKTGYNGLYRESKLGGYNVPFGRYENPALFDEANLRAVSQALQHVVLLNTDFSSVVETAQEGDLVYFDPPYVPLTKTSSFTSYTKGEFSLEQQIKLAEVVRQLTRKGVFVMLSNSNAEAIRELYKDLSINEVQASRAVNSKASLRGKITEVVVTNYQV